jgi:hypothetical protein
MIRIRILGVLSLSAAAGTAIALLHGRGPAAAGVAFAFALAAPSYLALSACLHRSDKTFFGVFLGGMGVRLAAGGTAIYVVHRVGVWPVAPFAVALAVGLMGLSVIELFFIQRQNSLWTSYKHSSTT